MQPQAVHVDLGKHEQDLARWWNHGKDTAFVLKLESDSGSLNSNWMLTKLRNTDDVA